MLREAEKFPSYMYKTYSLRKIKDAFKEHKAETDPEKIKDFISYAKSNLEIIKRQVVIGELYREPETILENHLRLIKPSQ
ncbi:hypothetical protein JTE90_007547 [Oedothorax gibbosus]|uniref:Complex 1 LYR protein domain-containing protein n=1 Tax=Oedothorax gibbosus TaxID=931172 RepID=A0AAV6VMB6_9ARAC|nr:hypothetical protein JTE90_007547 [Oedothorax gibbosus]